MVRPDVLRPSLLTRRAALGGGAAGALLLAAAASGPARAAVGGLAWTPTALSPREAVLVDAIAEIVMPKTDTPGAREAGVPQYIDRAMGGFYTPANVAVLRAGLAQIDADGRAAGAAGFVELPPAKQVDILKGYDQAALKQYRDSTTPRPAHFFLTLKQLVLLGYYSSKPGATITLKYDVLPGAYHGVVPYAQIGRAWAT